MSKKTVKKKYNFQVLTQSSVAVSRDLNYDLSSYCYTSSAFTSRPSSYLDRGQCPWWTPSYIQGHLEQVSLLAKRINNHLTVLSHDQNSAVSDCYSDMYFKSM